MSVRIGKIINYTVIYMFLIVAVIITIFPVLYVFLASFKDVQELMAGGINILPKHFTFNNYIAAWKAGNFSTYTLNSIIYSGFTTLITILFTTLMGFCMNRKEFFGKKFIMGTMIGSMFIAGAVTIYPTFLIIVKAGLHKTLIGLILASLGGGQVFGILLVLGYLNGVPKELDESATIDGCGLFGIYYKIILPVIKPVIGVVTLITFQNTWNNYMLPLALTMAMAKNRTLAVGVTALAYSGDGRVAAQWDLLIAGSCMAMIPILIIYIFANKHFVSGLTSGSVKS